MDIPQLTKDWLTRQLAVEFHIEKHSYSHQDDVYRIQTPEGNFYLKIASSLEKERLNLLRVSPYLRVPTVINFTRILGRDHLLLSEVPGKNLAELAGAWNDRDIVKEFARALKRFHALDVGAVFPGQEATGLVVSHGDMALPNIICTEPGSVSYIDLGQMHVDGPDADLADGIWSLQRNLGPDYGELFLEEYGDVVMTEKIDKALAFRYAS